MITAATNQHLRFGALPLNPQATFPYANLGLRIEKDDVGQLPNCYALINRIMRKEFKQKSRSSVDTYVRNRFSADKAGFLIIKNTIGKVVGTGGLWDDGGDEARLCNIFVDKKHRKHGIGRWITTHLLEQAKAVKAKTVSLGVTNPIAKRLYYSFGFRYRGQIPYHGRTSYELGLTLSSQPTQPITGWALYKALWVDWFKLARDKLLGRVYTPPPAVLSILDE